MIADVARTSQRDSIGGDSIKETSTKLELKNPIITITEIAGKECKLSALIATGSPVSFIRLDKYEKLIKSDKIELKSTCRKLRNLSGELLKVINKSNRFSQG